MPPTRRWRGEKSWPVARRADDDQGHLPDRRHAHHLRAVAAWDHVPERDAEAVRRLRDAGAVIFGKTNTPTLAGDWQTYNPIFGTTNNPWDTTRTTGGSSGGAAAARRRRHDGARAGQRHRGIDSAARRIGAACAATSRPGASCRTRGHLPPAPGSAGRHRSRRRWGRWRATSQTWNSRSMFSRDPHGRSGRRVAPRAPAAARVDTARIATGDYGSTIRPIPSRVRSATVLASAVAALAGAGARSSTRRLRCRAARSGPAVSALLYPILLSTRAAVVRQAGHAGRVVTEDDDRPLAARRASPPSATVTGCSPTRDASSCAP